MNIVYLIEFTDRIQNNIFPNKYIGSKSDCRIDNGKIISNKLNKEYRGSCRSKSYQTAVSSEQCRVIVLGEYDDYKSALTAERDIHLQLDVVSNKEYFNRGVATLSSYTDPNYGTFRHTTTGEFVRLPKDHALVLSGEYVNANKGMKNYNNGIKNIQSLTHPGDGWVLGSIRPDSSGENNYFYGKRHSQETKNKIIETRRKNDLVDVERAIVRSANSAIRCKQIFSGIPKSEEQKLKMSKSSPRGVAVINLLTKVCSLVSKEEYSKLDKTVWMTPFAAKRKFLDRESAIIITCPHCRKQSDSESTPFIRNHFDKCKKRI
jgi:hypothetical protein